MVGEEKTAYSGVVNKYYGNMRKNKAAHAEEGAPFDSNRTRCRSVMWNIRELADPREFLRESIVRLLNIS